MLIQTALPYHPPGSTSESDNETDQGIFTITVPPVYAQELLNGFALFIFHIHARNTFICQCTVLCGANRAPNELQEYTRPDMVHVRYDDDNWVSIISIMQPLCQDAVSRQVGGRCDDIIDKYRQLSREGYSLM